MSVLQLPLFSLLEIKKQVLCLATKTSIHSSLTFRSLMGPVCSYDNGLHMIYFHDGGIECNTCQYITAII